MKEKEFYKTPDGDIHKILMFDELNKMVYINIEGSRHRWVHEPEYSTWHQYNLYGDFVPDIPAQMSEEQIYLSDHNTLSHALQEPSTSRVFQHSQETVGESGSERGGVEQGVEGNEIAEKSKIKSEEETIVKPKRKYTKK